MIICPGARNSNRTFCPGVGAASSMLGLSVLPKPTKKPLLTVVRASCFIYALLRVVRRDGVGEVSGLLQHLLDLRPGQKASLQRLISDALRQPPDDPHRLIKSGTRLRRLIPCLIQRSQRRLDLPLFSRQPEICRQLGGLAQVVDGLLAVPIPPAQQST